MKEHNTIDQIYALSEQDAKELEPVTFDVNGHKLYMVDLEGYFGFSVLVFREGKHIYYADDFELHHKGKDHIELIEYYIQEMKNKLFSDDMIPQPVADYTEAERKEYYIRNYYPQMCDDKISAFHIFHNKAEEALFDKEVEGMTYNPVGFFYTNDKAFSDRVIELYKQAIKSKESSKDNYDYWFNAFKYEMFNHEYAINWDADADTLSAFGNFHYNSNTTLDDIFQELNFNDIQCRAYRAARSYVLANSDY